MAKAGILAILGTDGTALSSAGLMEYDGRTVIKRNGETKVMAFKSGKHGYFAGGKVMLDGKTYQLSCSIVELSNKVAAPFRQFTADEVAAMNAQAREHNDELDVTGESEAE